MPNKIKLIPKKQSGGTTSTLNAQKMNQNVMNGLTTAFQSFLSFDNAKKAGLTGASKNAAIGNSLTDSISSGLMSSGNPYAMAGGIALKGIDMIGGTLMNKGKTAKAVDNFKLNDDVMASSGYGGITDTALETSENGKAYKSAGLFGKLLTNKGGLKNDISLSNSRQNVASGILKSNKDSMDAGLNSQFMVNNNLINKNYNSNLWNSGAIQYGQQGMKFNAPTDLIKDLFNKSKPTEKTRDERLNELRNNPSQWSINDYKQYKLAEPGIETAAIDPIDLIGGGVANLTGKGIVGSVGVMKTALKGIEGMGGQMIRHPREMRKATTILANSLGRSTASILDGMGGTTNNYSSNVKFSEGGTLEISGSNSTKTSETYKKLGKAAKQIDLKKFKPKLKLQLGGTLKKPTIESIVAKPAVRNIQPIDNSQMEFWNGFVDYVDQKGYRGNPQLDDRSKDLSRSLFNDYAKTKNFTQSYDDFIPNVQTALQQKRKDLIQTARSGKANINGMIEYFGTEKPLDIGDEELEKRFMPGMSKIDGWAGSRTTTYKFPLVQAPKFSGRAPGQTQKEQARPVVFEKGGAINKIVDGKLHAHKHDLKQIVEFHDAEITDKGVPVITLSEGGEVIQHAEVEKDEIILHYDLTKKLEELFEEGSSEAMIEAGKLLAKEIIKNTKDSKSKILKSA